MFNNPLSYEIGKIELMSGMLTLNYLENELSFSPNYSGIKNSDRDKEVTDVWQHECYHFIQLITFGYLLDLSLKTKLQLDSCYKQINAKTTKISLEDLKAEFVTMEFPNLSVYLDEKILIVENFSEISCRDILEADAVLCSFKSNYKTNLSYHFLEWSEEKGYANTIESFKIVENYYGDYAFELFHQIVFWSFNTLNPLSTFKIIIEKIGKKRLIFREDAITYVDFYTILHEENIIIKDVFDTEISYHDKAKNSYLNKYINRLKDLIERKIDLFYQLISHPYQLRDGELNAFLPTFIRLKNRRIVMMQSPQIKNEEAIISIEDMSYLYILDGLFGVFSVLKGNVNFPYVQCHHFDCPYYFTNLCISNAFIPAEWKECSFITILEDNLKIKL